MKTRPTPYPETHEPPAPPPSRLRGWLLRAALAAGVIAIAALLAGDRVAGPARAAGGGPYIVNSANDADDGLCDVTHCSLREAINAANLNLPNNEIWFNIPGAGVHLISVGSSCGGCGLPAVTVPTEIRGETQPGYAGTPLIELRYCCNSGLPVNSGLILSGHLGSSVYGLAITQFDRAGILILGGGGHRIAENYVGINAQGTLDFGNSYAGIEINNSNNNTIGWSASTGMFSNVISGNDGAGILIVGTSGFNSIVKNGIGTYPDGTTGFVKNNTGIAIGDTAHETGIGGVLPGAANTIAGNGNWGIDESTSGLSNMILRNAIFKNGVGAMGITESPDEAAAPVVTSATWGALAVTPGVEGTSTCIGCTVEIFSSDDCQGRLYEGETTVTGGGTWQFRGTVSGPKITATVTNYSATSEFSNCVTLAGSPLLRPGGSLGVSLIDPPWDGVGPHVFGRTPGVPSDAMFDVRYPGFDSGPRDLVVHVTGSTMMPGGAPSYGSEVARLWVDFDFCGQGHYTLSAIGGAGGLDAGIPLTFENPAGATPYLPAGWNPLDVIAAVRGQGKDTALYDDAGSLVSGWTLKGDAYAFVLNSGLGGHDLVLGEVGSDTRLGCARITEIRLLLRGMAIQPPASPPLPDVVFRQNGAAGFYRAFATYSCAASPYGVPCPSPPEKPEPTPMGLLVQGCDYVDTSPPPAGLDADGDCLASPTDTNDANPDQDGDGVYDGIEFSAGTSMTNPDTDGDTVPDSRELQERTSSTPSSDFDGDGVADKFDNCPKVSNGSQADLDADGIGDACDNDRDGDGLTNAQEATMKLTVITTPANRQALRCDFGTPTLALIATDPDTDNDGWRDGPECTLGSNPLNAGSTPERCNGMDDDGDGLTDETPLAAGPLLEYDTNPANCIVNDPDGDGAMGVTEWKIRTKNRIAGEWEDLPAGALSCGDPNVDCNPDGDGLDSDHDPDSDNDGVSDLIEFGQYGTSPVSALSDNDGCTDSEELGLNPSLGGQRDPLNYWDFYDVGTSRGGVGPGDENFTKDKKVTFADTLIILDHFGHNGLDAHDHDMDRAIPDLLQPWRAAEEVAGGDNVTFTDVLNNLKSFGNDCSAPPN